MCHLPAVLFLIAYLDMNTFIVSTNSSFLLPMDTFSDIQPLIFCTGINVLFISAGDHADYLALIDSLDSGRELSDNNGWLNRTILPEELFPDIALSQKPVKSEDKDEDLDETQDPSSSSFAQSRCRRASGNIGKQSYLQKIM